VFWAALPPKTPKFLVILLGVSAHEGRGVYAPHPGPTPALPIFKYKNGEGPAWQDGLAWPGGDCASGGGGGRGRMHRAPPEAGVFTNH